MDRSAEWHDAPPKRQAVRAGDEERIGVDDKGLVLVLGDKREDGIDFGRVE
jgi:hypothetical protein